MTLVLTFRCRDFFCSTFTGSHISTNDCRFGYIRDTVGRQAQIRQSG